MKTSHFLVVALAALILATDLTRGQVNLCITPDEYDIQNLTM